MCGIVGIANLKNADGAAPLLYLGLLLLQHRGEESAGISSSDGTEIYTLTGMGMVADVFNEQNLTKLKGECAIGHNRYSTAGDSSCNNAQPIVVKTAFGEIAICHNGNLTNAGEKRRELQAQGAVFQTNSDTEVILHLIARAKSHDFIDCVFEALDQIKGAYSLLILLQDGTILAIRDPNGFRPLVLGKVGEAFVFASETSAFRLIGATLIREVEPGEMVYIKKGHLTEIKRGPDLQLGKCIFEHVYFANPSSFVFGRRVKVARDKTGEILAREKPVTADVIVHIPDSGVSAALGFARKSKIPFDFGLIRNQYVGRTFIEPKTTIRHFGVKVKLAPVSEILRGKRVVLVDDSIVRGTTTSKIVKMVREEGGAREVHVRVASPPFISPCYFGIDTPTRAELIAARLHSEEEVRREIGADSLGHLSIKGLLESLKADSNEFCVGCFTGKYPIPID